MLSTQRNPPFPMCTRAQSHLQSGTTMGLSLTPRNKPRSLSAASTAFLASNLGRPWMEEAGSQQCPSNPPPPVQVPTGQISSPGKAQAH